MKQLTLYCHFSFRRIRKEPGMVYLAVAFFRDYDGARLLEHKTVKRKLWEDQQFVTAIQSYEFALSCIYEWQGILSRLNVGQIILVTDNSTLAGWIENPKKNKGYAAIMERAVEAYRVTGPKEITLGIGLGNVRKYERSYKFCAEKYVEEEKPTNYVVKVDGTNRVSINKEAETEYSSIDEYLREDLSEPEIKGIKA